MQAWESSDMTDQSGRFGSEVDRLRRELAASRQRLEDEVTYYRGQVEHARKRAEAEHLRVQASEVSRRRQLEDEVAALRTRLHDAKEHGDRLQRRYDELSEQYLKQEAAGRDTVEARIAQYQAAAREAWRSAEEEVARMEREISEAHEALEKERNRSRDMENSLRRVKSQERDSENRRTELLDEAAALRQALNLSERARVQSHRRAVQLRERLEEVNARLEDLERRPAGASRTGGHAGADGKPVRQRFFGSAYAGVDNPSEVDLSKANAVLRDASGPEDEALSTDAGMSTQAAMGPQDLDFSDEFLLISTDESLDRRKVARLREQVEEAELRASAEQDGKRGRGNQSGTAAGGNAGRGGASPSTPAFQPRQPHPQPTPQRSSAVAGRSFPVGKAATGMAVAVALAGASTAWLVWG